MIAPSPAQVFDDQLVCWHFWQSWCFWSNHMVSCHTDNHNSWCWSRAGMLMVKVVMVAMVTGSWGSTRGVCADTACCSSRSPQPGSDCPALLAATLSGTEWEWQHQGIQGLPPPATSCHLLLLVIPVLGHLTSGGKWKDLPRVFSLWTATAWEKKVEKINGRIRRLQWLWSVSMLGKSSKTFAVFINCHFCQSPSLPPPYSF